MILGHPQNDQEKWKSLALAASVHIALVVALFVGVQWKSKAPASVEVELWDSVPAVRSAPPPPPPPPDVVKPEPKPEPKIEPKPEPKPDIAIKDDKKKKEEPKKPEPPKKEEPKKPEPKPEPRPDPFKEQLEREQKQLDQQKRMQQQTARADAEARALNQAKSEQAAASRAKGLADYSSKIRGKIRGNTVLPQAIQGNPQAVFEITQLPSGEVISVRLKKSSGNANLDAAVERAILKSSPLPKPDQPELFMRVLEIKYTPFED
ncbi:MAG: colicin import rane protein [Pseudomonadota bacterium]|nr:colicin import rane protein [Pseudomonadota bacterium]